MNITAKLQMLKKEAKKASHTTMPYFIVFLTVDIGGVVSRNKAKNELAQLKAEDPLPLRKARITLEAALKRAEKTRAPFEAATKVAEDARYIFLP